MSKYEPLREYLKSSGKDRVTLTFTDLERVLGSALPASARTHSAWWANEATPQTHVQKKAWMAAGYRVGFVDQRGGLVRFERER